MPKKLQAVGEPDDQGFPCRAQGLHTWSEKGACRAAFTLKVVCTHAPNTHTSYSRANPRISQLCPQKRLKHSSIPAAAGTSASGLGSEYRLPCKGLCCSGRRSFQARARASAGHRTTCQHKTRAPKGEVMLKSREPSAGLPWPNLG